MSFLLCVLVAALSAVVGLVCGGVLAEFSVRWLRIHGGQGNAAYFTVMMALLGAGIGLVVGMIAAGILSPRNGAGFGRALGASSGVLVFVTLVSLGVCRLFAHVPPTIDGRRLSLEVEVRLPTGATVPKTGSDGAGFVQLHAMLGSSSRHVSVGALDPEHARQENGRWIVPASLVVESSLGSRKLVIERSSTGPKEEFTLPLPPSPRRGHLQWSGWLPASEGQSPEAADARLSYRFRVQMVAPRDYRKEAAARDAQAFRDSRAALDALPADAPLTTFLEYTRYGPPDGIKPLAIARMAEKTNFVAEMQAMMLAKDADVSAEFLRLVPEVANPSPDLLRAVEAAGRDIAEQIRTVNVTPPKNDPEFYGARGVATRFRPWLMAVARLRVENDGDFIPELTTILELSRVRKDITAMREDVCRVASLCLKDWAGVAPLPSDPPPR